MFELGDLLAEILLRYPMLLPFYAVGLWYLIIRPLIRWLGEEKLEATELRKYTDESDPGSEMAQETGEETNALDSWSVKDYLDDVYDRWQDGVLDQFSTSHWFETTVQTKSQFRASLEHLGPALSFAFKDERPSGDETVIAGATSSTGLSYILTNYYFYFFGLDRELLANNYDAGKVSFSAIESVAEFKRKKSGQIEFLLNLCSGTSLTVKDCPDAIPYLFIADAIETRGCAKTDSQVRIDKGELRSKLFSFLLYSYQSWKDETLAPVSDYYADVSSDMEAQELVDSLMSEEPKYRLALWRYLEIRQPQQGEFLVDLVPGSYMLTNKCLWIHEKTGRVRFANLESIDSYTKKGILSEIGTITLTNGDEVDFAVESAPEFEKIKSVRSL